MEDLAHRMALVQRLEGILQDDLDVALQPAQFGAADGGDVASLE